MTSLRLRVEKVEKERDDVMVQRDKLVTSHGRLEAEVEALAREVEHPEQVVCLRMVDLLHACSCFVFTPLLPPCMSFFWTYLNSQLLWLSDMFLLTPHMFFHVFTRSHNDV